MSIGNHGIASDIKDVTQAAMEASADIVPSNAKVSKVRHSNTNQGVDGYPESRGSTASCREIHDARGLHGTASTMGAATCCDNILDRDGELVSSCGRGRGFPDNATLEDPETMDTAMAYIIHNDILLFMDGRTGIPIDPRKYV